MRNQPPVIPDMKSRCDRSPTFSVSYVRLFPPVNDHIPTGSMVLVYLPIHEWLIFMVNVGKYTIPMDCMGYPRISIHFELMIFRTSPGGIWKKQILGNYQRFFCGTFQASPKKMWQTARSSKGRGKPPLAAPVARQAGKNRPLGTRWAPSRSL